MLSTRVVAGALPLVKRAIAVNKPCVSGMALRLAHGSHGPPAHYKEPTMDELPVPCGSWQEHYDSNQRKYNIHLLLGSGVFLITFFVGYFSGAFDLYMFTADRPAPRR